MTSEVLGYSYYVMRQTLLFNGFYLPNNKRNCKQTALTLITWNMYVCILSDYIMEYMMVKATYSTNAQRKFNERCTSTTIFYSFRTISSYTARSFHRQLVFTEEMKTLATDNVMTSRFGLQQKPNGNKLQRKLIQFGLIR